MKKPGDAGEHKPGRLGQRRVASRAAKWAALAITGSVKKSGVCLGFENLAPTIETVGADVVPQMQLTGGGLDGGTRGGERIV